MNPAAMDSTGREKGKRLKKLKTKVEETKVPKRSSHACDYHSTMGLCDLPDDILSYILDYLDPVDFISLIESSLSGRFKLLIEQKRIVNFSCCFACNLTSFNNYMKTRIIPQKVRVLNLSHCYWLPQYALIEATEFMRRLEELYIHDTKVNVIHMPKIFRSCPKLTKLSVNVAQDSWKRFKPTRRQFCPVLSKGFAQLTYLKMIWVQEDIAWLIVAQLLCWSIKCLNLQLEPFFTLTSMTNRRSIDYARNKFFPKLTWMANLKSFVYKRRGFRNATDHMVVALCEWMASNIEFKQIEHFWIQPENVSDPVVPSTVKSFYVSKLPVEAEKSLFLTCVGNINLPCNYSLPQLKYFNGRANNLQDLYDFCKQHPQLKHLVVVLEVGHVTLSSQNVPKDWLMPYLRKFFVQMSITNEELIKRIPDIMPNLEELTIECDMTLVHIMIELTFIPRLQYLKKLSLCGRFVGHPSILYQIMEDCKEIQSLRIAGIHTTDHNGFLASLCVALPLAVNLTDFHLFWRCRSAAGLNTILTAIEKCPNLRRVVIDPDMKESDPLLDLPWLTEKILRSINTLSRLVMFCLLMEVDLLTLEVTKEKLSVLVLPQRPSLWCYLGKNSLGSVEAPAVHQDQILFPIHSVTPLRFL